MLRYANRKDNNDAELLRIARQCGAFVIQMQPGQGFDWLAIRRGQIFIIEIKDGKKTRSQQKLTACERETKDQVEYRGVRYHIVKTTDELMELWK